MRDQTASLTCSLAQLWARWYAPPATPAPATKTDTLLGTMLRTPFLTRSVTQRRPFFERTCQTSSDMCKTSKRTETVTAGLEPAA